MLPSALIARATFDRALGKLQGAIDLAEAYEIAARGQMRLHLTDYHLESARLQLTQLAPAEALQPVPRGMWQRIFGAAPVEAGTAPQAVLPLAEAQGARARAEEHYEAACQLIGATGYKRRLPELEAIRACLDGEIMASVLAPDRDRNDRPAAA